MMKLGEILSKSNKWRSTIDITFGEYWQAIEMYHVRSFRFLFSFFVCLNTKKRKWRYERNLINWILNVMHEKTNRFWTDYGLSNNLPSGLLLHMEDILRSWLIFCVVLLSESRSIHFLDSPSIAVSRILVQMPLRYSNLFVAWWDTWVEKKLSFDCERRTSNDLRQTRWTQWRRADFG